MNTLGSIWFRLPKLALIASLLIFANIPLAAQGTADSERLAKLKYMENVDRINCDSMVGTNLESRICLNLEFQRADSTMVSLFNNFVQQVEPKKLQQEFITYQSQWVEHRRRQSHWMSEGYRGHMLGIVYLNQMLIITEHRIAELKELTRSEK